MANNKNSIIAKNTLFLSIRMIFVLFVSLYTSRVFLRVLGVEDFGINNVVCGFVAMFSFLNTSLANGIQRFYNSEMSLRGENGVSIVYKNSLIIQSLIAILVVLLLETFGLWYLNNIMIMPAERLSIAKWIFQFSVLSTALTIMQTPYSAAIMAYERMNYYAFVGILDVVLKLSVAFIIPFIPMDKLLLFGLLMLMIAVLNLMLYYFYCKKLFKSIRVKRESNWSLAKNMVVFSGWNFGGTFACMVREQGLNLVLNLFFGPVVNAARGVAYQVSSALQGFVQNISVAAKPQMVSSYAEGDSSRTIKLMYSMSKISFAILLLMALPICIEIHYVLKLWLGDSIPLHTANFVVLVILTNLFNNLNAPLSNVVYATGKMKKYEIVFSVTNLLIVPIAYLFLYLGYQPEIAFVVYLVMSVVVQTFCVMVLKTLVQFSVRDYLKSVVFGILLCACVTIPLPLFVHYYMPSSFARLFLITLITIIVGTISFYYFSLDQGEKNIATKAIRTITDKLIIRKK